MRGPAHACQSSESRSSFPAQSERGGGGFRQQKKMKKVPAKANLDPNVCKGHTPGMPTGDESDDEGRGH
jgi:hypothetical protein